MSSFARRADRSGCHGQRRFGDRFCPQVASRSSCTTAAGSSCTGHRHHHASRSAGIGASPSRWSSRLPLRSYPRPSYRRARRCDRAGGRGKPPVEAAIPRRSRPADGSALPKPARHCRGPTELVQARYSAAPPQGRSAPPSAVPSPSSVDWTPGGDAGDPNATTAALRRGVSLRVARCRESAGRRGGLTPGALPRPSPRNAARRAAAAPTVALPESDEVYLRLASASPRLKAAALEADGHWRLPG